MIALDAPADELVLTPGGLRRAANVHLVPPGWVLDGTGGVMRLLDRQRNVAADFGALERHPAGTPLMPAHVAAPPAVAPYGSGWITYASWTNETGTPVSSFSTTWIVPEAPTTESGQVIFLFNGIQNSTMIFQPVLQWGESAAGGGNYWAVATWYADSQNGNSYFSSLVPVSVGQALTGIMRSTGQGLQGFNYDGNFDGISNSGYSIENVEELTYCVETLEAYGITQCSDYPGSAWTAMSAINLQTGTTTPNVNWAPTDRVTDCGQHCVIADNSASNGEVDLWYTSEAPPLTIPVVAAFVANNSTGGILTITSPDGQHWSTDHGVGQTSSQGPALAALGDTLVLAFVANNSTGNLLTCTSTDGIHWSGSHGVGQLTNAAPALGVLGGTDTLVMAFVAGNATRNLLTSTSTDGINWSTDHGVGQTSSQGPALAALGSTLVLAFVANNSTGNLLTCTSTDGIHWSGNNGVAGQSSKAAPALAVLGGTLVMAFVANNTSGDLLVCTSTDGLNWSGNFRVGQLSKTAPALASDGNQLTMTFVANNATNTVLSLQSTDGVHWFGDNSTGQLSRTSTAVHVIP